MFCEISDVYKSYGDQGKDNYTKVLRGVDTQIEKGQMCVILGPSGSGKSTLLNVIGGLDDMDTGSIVIDGINIAELNSYKLVDFRRQYMGYVFQFYNLIPNLSVQENIEVCGHLTKNPLELEQLMRVLGLYEHRKKFPSQISGGQQQRCAIARALVKNPKLLLCDEPTGALDYKTSKEILCLLETINQEYGTTMLIVTHNEQIRDMANKVIKIKDGKICEDYINEKPISANEIEW
ncbi:MAG: ABC transporter ATP-binding protein [Suipraeoptans sp.]